MVRIRQNYFGRWARNRALLAQIQNALASGQRVTLGTYTRATTYDSRHASQFTADASGCYVAQRKRRVDITGCAVIIHA